MPWPGEKWLSLYGWTSQAALTAAAVHPVPTRGLRPAS